jgi:hypothetical protein
MRRRLGHGLGHLDRAGRGLLDAGHAQQAVTLEHEQIERGDDHGGRQKGKESHREVSVSRPVLPDTVRPAHRRRYYAEPFRSD